MMMPTVVLTLRHTHVQALMLVRGFLRKNLTQVDTLLWVVFLLSPGATVVRCSCKTKPIPVLVVVVEYAQ